MWYFICIPLVYLLFKWKGKVDFYEMRIGKEKILAQVIEYRDHKSPMRNDYTQIPYPYVRVNPEDKDSRLIKLKYANNMWKPFKIGDQVGVFWYGGVLYYWDSYDSIITKYLPSRWDFWNRG